MRPLQHEHNHEVVVQVPEVVKIKQHFENNKKLYFTGIGGFALGYILRGSKVITITNEITPTFVITEAGVSEA